MKLKTVFCLFFLLATAVIAADFSLEKAKRIEQFLNRIAMRRQPSLFLKKATFSESELNSYLNLIYVKKYAPEVTFIELRLRDKDEVSGSLKVKLAGEKYAAVPQFLRDIEVRFQGQIRMQQLPHALCFPGTGDQRQQLFAGNSR